MCKTIKKYFQNETKTNFLFFSSDLDKKKEPDALLETLKLEVDSIKNLYETEKNALSRLQTEHQLTQNQLATIQK